MKKLVIASLIGLSSIGSAYAHGPHGHWHHGGDGRWFWLAPMVVGGVVAYEVARPPVIVQQPQPVVVQGQNCSPWTQIQNPDGTITSTRTCQ